jgi:outer membrane protein assembly factor BamD
MFGIAHCLSFDGAAPRRAVHVFVAALLLALSLAGCGLLPEGIGKDETAGWSAERLYKNAHEMLVEGNYTRAVKLYETLESRFPYGRYAQQAILESAYASYRAGETATAVAACDRFIRTYPNHPNVDYAYYLKGLVHFREDQGLLGYVYELDLSEREPKAMRESFAAFKELVAKFPESRYAQDATDRMRYLTNALALYEVHVAEYYYRRGAYVASLNRAQGALTSYPRTPANQQALQVMILCYGKLGMTQLKDDTARIMAQTYPEGGMQLVQAPWWKFWGKGDDGLPVIGQDLPPGQPQPKPWWQFW